MNITETQPSGKPCERGRHWADTDPRTGVAHPPLTRAPASLARFRLLLHMAPRSAVAPRPLSILKAGPGT